MSAWSSARNVLRNAVRPGYLPVMADKVVTRIAELDRSRVQVDATKWAQHRAESAEEYARACSPSIWAEADAFSDELRARADDVLSSTGVDLGRGGHYPLLYFLVRLVKPDVVVETGVAAGWSSAAILRAMERNNRGHLWSSDFPYFRLAEPEQYVGLLVDRALRRRWTLLLAGDSTNLRRVTERVERIDLFHYDSDKSYRGRARALRLLDERFDDASVIVMDDIQNNFFFRDALTAPGRSRIFEFEGKYLGTVALPATS